MQNVGFLMTRLIYIYFFLGGGGGGGWGGGGRVRVDVKGEVKFL